MNRRNLVFLAPYNPLRLFALVDNKPAAKRVLTAAGIPVPETYAEISVQWEIRRLGAMLEPRADFVIKPARGSGGGGIQVFVGRRDGRFVKASGASVTLSDLADHCSDILAGAYSLDQRADQVLIEERVRAEPVLGALSYRGVPDVRVLAFRGVPLLAMIRLPTSVSDGRGNLHMGGMGVGVDLVSGLTVYGLLGRRPTTVHPDLGCPIVGVTVPCWETVLAVAARCYEAVPLGYLGVDIVVDVKRGPLVLELNARPGLSIQLANHRGLRPLMEAVAARDVERLSLDERIALGRELSRRV